MCWTAGLSQVLSDGTNVYVYVYGNGRIVQRGTNVTEYYLSDALGSVRQLTNPGGAVTLTAGTIRLGQVVTTQWSSSSVYSYTGEQTDPSEMVI